MSLMFCNIAWMTDYKGQYGRKEKIVDQPERGGKYVQENGEAHESCNFLSDSSGLVYGHVETWRGDSNTGRDTKIGIENLGASKQDLYIDGVDVIWIATHEGGGKRVVGWYQNARVYRTRQFHSAEFATKQHKRDNINSYRIVAKYENTVLINEEERSLILDPNNNRTGWPGRSSIFYPSNYDHNEELSSFIVRLKEVMKSGITNGSDQVEDDAYQEGGDRLSHHKRRERSSKLVKAFKNQLKDYSCVICGFSFEEFYGSLGKEYIEAHHLVPVSLLSEATKVSISDLAAVCSNCHRMLHRTKEPISVNELGNIVKSQRTRK